MKGTDLQIILKLMGILTSTLWDSTVYYNKSYKRELSLLIICLTSVDTEMCCPKGKCGCQYFIFLTLKKKNHGHRGPGYF